MTSAKNSLENACLPVKVAFWKDGWLLLRSWKKKFLGSTKKQLGGVQRKAEIFQRTSGYFFAPGLIGTIFIIPGACIVRFPAFYKSDGINFRELIIQ